MTGVGDLLVSLLVFTVLVTAGLAGLAALTVVPFAVALGQAQARGLSAGRVGALAAAGVLLGLALAGAAVLSGAAPALALPALLLTWAVPVLLRVRHRPRLAGRAGRHE